MVKHILAYPNTWSRQKLWCFFLSLALILVLAAVGVGLAVSQGVSAVTGANTYTAISVEEISDGTGQGTSSACFINSENGYATGDNTETDGIVCLGDNVTYNTSVNFIAGPARTVVVGLGLPSNLMWPASSHSVFCKSGQYVTATVQGSTCVYKVPAGVSETIATTLILTATDSAGQVVTGQNVSLTTALQTSSSTTDAVYNEADAKAVTVVSAPAADVILNSANSCVYPKTSPTTKWTDSSTSGTMYAVPCPLAYSGYSLTKGGTAELPWSGSVEVSSFPAGTTFTVNGKAVAVSGGSIPVDNVIGSVAIKYSLPDGWPAQEEGTVINYDMHVTVASNSFSTSEELNNGSGTQPGDGQSKSTSTYDVERGAQKGNIYPNNDYSAVVVYNPPPPPKGAVLGKQISGPRSSSYTIWDSQNIVEGQSPNAYRGASCFTKPDTLPCNSVARSTQLLDMVSVFANNLFNAQGTDDPQLTAEQIAGFSGQLIIGDTWNPAQQTFDVSRLADFALLDPEGNPIPSGDYTVQYATSPKTPAQVEDIDDPGWIVGTPTASAAAIRLIVDESVGGHIIPFYSEEGTGQFIMQVPLSINSSLAPSGTTVTDTASFNIANVTNVDPSITAVAQSGSTSDQVVLELPTTPTSKLADSLVSTSHTNTMTNPPTVTVTHNTVNGQAVSSGNPAIVNPSVSSGDATSFTLNPSVQGMPNSNPVDATVTVALDPCQLTPTLASGSPWKMSVIPGTGVCGQPGATGATLTFTLDDVVPTWTDILGDGTFPSITYTTTSSVITPNGNQIVNPASLHVTGVADDVSADAMYTSLTASDSARSIRETEEHSRLGEDGMSIGEAEINRDLTWNADLYSYSGETQGGPIDAIVILPKSGGENCTAGDSYVYSDIEESLTGYTEAHCSNYSGSYVLSSASFDENSTSSDVSLYCTTKANPTFDAGPVADLATDGWIPYSADACAHATALRVVRDAAPTVSTASLNITLTPTGNSKGDVYVMWLSSNVEIESQSGAVWPAQIDVVSSSLSGTVWWDDNSNGVVDAVDDSTGTPAEKGIAGVQVCLHMKSADGSAGGVVIDPKTGKQVCAATDAEGYYSFADLNSGEYVVEMAKGTVIPDTVTTKYGQELDVTETYTYKNLMGQRVSLDADANIPFAGDLPDVNFGWIEPDPSIQLDKSLVSSSCSDASAVCSAMWQIDVQNNGNQMVTPTVTDVLSQKPLSESVQKGYAAPHTFTYVEEGLNNTVALDKDGHVWVWGGNFYGSVGNNSHVSPPAPVDVTPAGVTFISAHVGLNTTVALDSTGHIWAWGYNFNGELGIGSTAAVIVPMDVTPAGVTFTKVDNDYSVTVALDSTGHIWAWGDNTHGQVGNGTTTDVLTPTDVTPMGVTFINISDNDFVTLALDSTGHIWAWGVATSGNGTTTDVLTPTDVTPAGASFVSADTESYTTVALDSTGHIWAWGYNNLGQLGNGTYTDTSALTDVTPAGVTFTKVDEGIYVTVALDSTGHIWTWGDNNYGSVGNGTTKHMTTPTDVTPSGVTFVDIREGQYTTVALDSTGHIWAWGKNDSGSVGNGTTVTPVLTPTDVTPAGVTFTSVSINSATVAALDDNGHVWTWGENGSYQIGDGTTTDVLLPKDVTPAPTLYTGPFMSVESGSDNDVAIELVPLSPGQSTSVLVTATFPQQAYEQVVANQAYVDASNTPIAGLPAEVAAGRSTPVPPTAPPVEDFDSLGVTGNLTCDTNVDTALATDGSIDEMTGYTVGAAEDSCDQVPALFSPYAVAPSLGNLTGQVWYDANGDGLEQAPGVDNTGEYMVSGITATLTQKASGGSATTSPTTLPAGATPFTETTTTSTGSDGKLDCDGNQLPMGGYAFCNLPIGSYTVQFGITAAANPAAPHDSYRYTVETSSQAVFPQPVPPTNLNASGLSLSLPSSASGLTAAQRVYANETTTNVNAGLISVGVSISVVKDSPTYSDQNDTVVPKLPLDSSTGKSAPVEDVSFTATNTGQDSLTYFSWSDETDEGPAVVWKSCSLPSPTYDSILETDPDTYNKAAALYFTFSDDGSSGSMSQLLSLAPGASITCKGTLPAMAAASGHHDTLTVNGQGITTSKSVSSGDTWAVTVPLILDIEKLAKDADGISLGSLAGSQWLISNSAADAANGTADPNVSISLNPAVTTDNVWSVLGLQPNADYWLTETAAPRGYSLLATPIEFTVNANGGLVLISGQGSGSSVVATGQFGTGGTIGVQALDGIPVLSIRDVNTLALPVTGGSGVEVFWIASGVLAALVCALVALQRVRR
jgi:alpha-tubulin suppressor-like RCC1 family protein